MVSMKLKEYLEQESVAHTHHFHPLAYTSQEVAALTHIPGRQIAKSVILKANERRLIMAVLSANDTVNLDVLRETLGCKTLRLATEDEFRDAFPTCVVGAMPPFGNIFYLPTYCESSLSQNPVIEFNAGTHHDTIRMAFVDFKRLANPRMLHFARPGRYRYPQRNAA